VESSFNLMLVPSDPFTQLSFLVILPPLPFFFTFAAALLNPQAHHHIAVFYCSFFPFSLVRPLGRSPRFFFPLPFFCPLILNGKVVVVDL